MLNMSAKERTVLFTGAFRFPDKDAASQRVLGIAKALKTHGFTTIFCGWENSPRNEDLQNNGVYKFAGFEYYSLSELDIAANNVFQKTYHFIFRGNKTIRWIKNYLKDNKLDYIVVYNSFSYFIYRLFRLSKKHNFKLICDCTEWYEGNHLPGGKYGIVNFDNNFRIRVLYPLIKNVIVVSSFLQTYLKKKNCNTIIVPPLIDPKDIKWNLSAIRPIIPSGNIKRILYAGDPGKKDLLEPILRALELINISSIQLEFVVLGIDCNNFKNMWFSKFDEIPTYIRCIGCVPQNEVPKYYQNSNLSVLLRENKRYSNAGFPTKLVESLTSGVPVITNRTSDISAYIIDGENGFLLKDISVPTLVDCFHLVYSLGPYELNRMSEIAKKSSLENFDFQLYSNSLKSYFLNVR